MTRLPVVALPLLFSLVAGLTACGRDTDERPCTDSSECIKGGEPGPCLPSPVSDQSWCAFDDGACNSSQRWSPLTGDGLADECVDETSPDAGVDAGATDAGVPDASLRDAGAPDGTPPPPQFDVAYVSDITAGSETTFFSSSQLVRIANAGSSALDLSTATITNVVTDDTRWNVSVTWNAFADGTLNPGFSGGALSSEAAALIVDSGLMTEPVEDISQGYLTLSLSDGPTSGTWLVVHVDAILTIENARANLRFTMIASGAGTSVTLDDATRVSSTPL